jgi:hypothetical protein
VRMSVVQTELNAFTMAASVEGLAANWVDMTRLRRIAGGSAI